MKFADGVWNHSEEWQCQYTRVMERPLRNFFWKSEAEGIHITQVTEGILLQ